MSSGAAAVGWWTLFGIWLEVNWGVCRRDNGTDGRWQFVLGIEKLFLTVDEGHTVKPGGWQEVEGPV